MCLNYFFQRMVIEMAFNNEIQIIFFLKSFYIFKRKKYIVVYTIKRTLDLNFNFFIGIKS
jgi:hypothetical protein